MCEVQKYKLYDSDLGSSLQLNSQSPLGDGNVTFNEKDNVHLGLSVSSSAHNYIVWSMAVML